MTFGFHLSNYYIENNMILSFVPGDFNFSKGSELSWFSVWLSTISTHSLWLNVCQVYVKWLHFLDGRFIELRLHLKPWCDLMAFQKFYNALVLVPLFFNIRLTKWNLSLRFCHMERVCFSSFKRKDNWPSVNKTSQVHLVIDGSFLEC